jgi:hypothetical protein
MRTPPNEADRLATLHRTGLLDSDPAESFDRVTRLAARTEERSDRVGFAGRYVPSVVQITLWL